MRRRLMALLPFLFAAASCGDEPGTLEVKVHTELCSPGGETELSEVAILLGSGLDLLEPPEFAARFEGCADVSDGVIFEQSFVPPEGMHQVIVIAAVKRGDEVGTVDGCLHELTKPFVDKYFAPCLIAARYVWTVPNSETMIDLPLRDDCFLPSSCSAQCFDEWCD
jgi:hypothetical protein